MNFVWLSSNLAAGILFSRLQARCVLPWFRTLLAVMLIQAAALAWLGYATRGYALTWVVTEFLLLLLEGASVLELVNLLIRGRLNTTLESLRTFGLVIFAVSFAGAGFPWLYKGGAGWAPALQFLVRARGYTALGMLLFLVLVSWILLRQPVPVPAGLMRHAVLLAANFVLLSGSMLPGSFVARPKFQIVQVAMLTGTGLLFAAWTVLLWSTPLSGTGGPADPETAATAEEKYREFRDRVRSLKL